MQRIALASVFLGTALLGAPATAQNTVKDVLDQFIQYQTERAQEKAREARQRTSTRSGESSPWGDYTNVAYWRDSARLMRDAINASFNDPRTCERWQRELESISGQREEVFQLAREARRDRHDYRMEAIDRQDSYARMRSNQEDVASQDLTATGRIMGGMIYNLKTRVASC